MGNTFRCPGCKHLHPNAIGAATCGCNDCYLLSGQIPVGFMGETASRRYSQLHEWMREDDDLHAWPEEE